MHPKQDRTPPTFNKVFVVYGKDSGLSESDFRENFQRFGDITSINISKQNGRPKGYTYIGYNKTSEACLAMEEMDGQIICNLKRPMRVHLAHDKRDNLEIDVDQDHMLERLCVRHPKEQDEESMREHFIQFGRIIRVHALTDKSTKNQLGVAFVKYEKQSSAALALEECDQSYKPRWADVRKKSNLEQGDSEMGARPMFDNPYGMRGGPSNIYGGVGGGMNDDFYGMGRKEQQGGGFSMGGGGRFGASKDFGPSASDMGMGFDAGPRKIEAMVPPSLTKQQIFRIFDIAQGLETFAIDPSTGMATVEYVDNKSALHAKEKIDGLDIFGQSIAVRMAKPKHGIEETAQQLQQTLASFQSGRGNPANLNHLVQSIQQVSNALQSQGGMQGGDMEEMVPWCNVPLPSKKQMLPRNTPQKGKLFIVTVPEAVPNEMLKSAFSRFGDLIVCGYQPGKRYGFANFASREAAGHALEVLHGASLMGNQLKVEFSTQNQESQNGDEMSRKRPRMY